MARDEEITGEELLRQMDPAARAEAEEELSQIEPGGSEPFRIGEGGVHTDADDDPISEGGSSRQDRP